MGKIRGRVFATISTALYPAIDAMDESASMLCALVVRGISSTANAVTPVCATCCTISAELQIAVAILVIGTVAQHLHNNVALREHNVTIWQYLCAFLLILAIGISGFEACASLNGNLEPCLGKHGHNNGGQSNPPFSGINFFWNANYHNPVVLSGNRYCIRTADEGKMRIRTEGGRSRLTISD